MKNKITQVGEYSIIHVVNKKGELFDVLVDTEDIVKLYALNTVFIQKRPHTVYAMTSYKSKNIMLHRYLLGLFEYSPDLEVDHINKNGLDNRKKNLRVLTHAGNLQNRNTTFKNKKNNLSNCIHKMEGGGYDVIISVNKKIVYRRRFGRYIEAKLYRDIARALYLPYSQEFMLVAKLFQNNKEED